VTHQTNRYTSHRVLVATGAWAARLQGLPMPLPIRPVRGQMMAFGTERLRHVVYGAGGYAVPKADGNTLVGSTMEDVGFDADTTEEGLSAVQAIARAILPSLAEVPMSAYWAGLRPMTPDMLPVLGPDPDDPRVVYACGHSRNGILLAPITAHVIGDLVTGVTPKHDVTPFRPARFS